MGQVVVEHAPHDRHGDVQRQAHQGRKRWAASARVKGNRTGVAGVKGGPILAYSVGVKLVSVRATTRPSTKKTTLITTS